jgi:hypothetical protein
LNNFSFLDAIAINPKTDEVLIKLANYLKDGMNFSIQKMHPQTIAVRDALEYDAVNPALSRFPLLKVYRITTTFNPDFTSSTDAVVAYCLNFPSVDELPGILRWAAKTIAYLLRSYALFEGGNCPLIIDLDRPIKAEYRIMVNEVSQPVYAFLRINFTFKEN